MTFRTVFSVLTKLGIFRCQVKKAPDSGVMSAASGSNADGLELDGKKLISDRRRCGSVSSVGQRIFGMGRVFISLVLVVCVLSSAAMWQAWAAVSDEKDTEKTSEETTEESSEEEEEEPPLLDGAARVTADYLRNELEFNNASTAAVLYAIQEASAFEPMSLADGDSVLGLCKWSGSRLRALNKYCDKYYLNSATVTAQLRFMSNELKTSFPDQYNILLTVSDDPSGIKAAGEVFSEYLVMPEDDDEDIVIFRTDEIVTAYEPPPTQEIDFSTIVRESLPTYSAEEYFALLTDVEGMPEEVSVRQAEVIVGDFLRNEMGFNNAVTAGILANIYDESGFDTRAVGDNNTTFGMCQWGQRRYKSFLQSCEYHEVSEYDLMAQLGLLQSELIYSYPNMMKYIDKCEDSVEGAKEAARLFCKNFEVPRSLSTQLKEREKLTEAMYYPMLSGLSYERINRDNILKEKKK